MSTEADQEKTPTFWPGFLDLLVDGLKEAEAS